MGRPQVRPRPPASSERTGAKHRQVRERRVKTCAGAGERMQGPGRRRSVQRRSRSGGTCASRQTPVGPRGGMSVQAAAARCAAPHAHRPRRCPIVRRWQQRAQMAASQSKPQATTARGTGSHRCLPPQRGCPCVSGEANAIASHYSHHPICSGVSPTGRIVVTLAQPQPLPCDHHHTPARHQQA